MNTIQEIENAIEKLSEEQIEELRVWLFDRDIARDAAGGLLDGLAAEARRDVHAGHTKPL